MKRLEKQPVLLKRFKELLNIVKNSTGDIQKANEEEMRVIKELREMDNETLTSWGKQQVSILTENYKKKDSCIRQVKKLCWHTIYGKITVNEVLFRESHQTLRPFSSNAGVSCRSYSMIAPLAPVYYNFLHGK